MSVLKYHTVNISANKESHKKLENRERDNVQDGSWQRAESRAAAQLGRVSKTKGNM